MGSLSETQFFINHTSCKMLMCSVAIAWDMKILNASEYAIILMARGLQTVYPMTIGKKAVNFIDNVFTHTHCSNHKTVFCAINQHNKLLDHSAMCTSNLCKQ